MYLWCSERPAETGSTMLKGMCAILVAVPFGPRSGSMAASSTPGMRTLYVSPSCANAIATALGPAISENVAPNRPL